MAWKKNKCNRKCFVNILQPIKGLKAMDINEILVKPQVQYIVLEINWLHIMVIGKHFRNKMKKFKESNIEQKIDQVDFRAPRIEYVKIKHIKQERSVRTTPVVYTYNIGLIQ